MSELQQEIQRLVIMRLNKEIEATESLLLEGDPFYMTRKDYLDNLKMLRGEVCMLDSCKLLKCLICKANVGTRDEVDDIICQNCIKELKTKKRLWI